MRFLLNIAAGLLAFLSVASYKDVLVHLDTPIIEDEKACIDVFRQVCERINPPIQFSDVVLAQYTWETAFGSSKIFKQNHNGYGMKYRRVKPPDVQYALGIKNGHAYYKNHISSLADYAQWQRRLLKSRPDVKTEEEYLQMLDDYNVPWCPDCRYAEDTTYTDKIRARMSYLRTLR